MDKPKELWFKDIAKPESVLGDSKGYLDRLSGCSDLKDRQYLGKRKLIGSQDNQDKRRPKVHNKVQAQITPESIVDDEKWLEERRKKFPRVDVKKKLKEAETVSVGDKNESKINKTSSRSPNPIQRSKTISLFDRLMGDSEE